MYIRTRDELGQAQATWPTLPTFNRLRAQPTPIPYLGNFNEPSWKAEPCKETWTVWGFAPGSAKLLDFQKKHIKDIATRITDLMRRDLNGKQGGVRAHYHVEGHVDKKTDPAKYGELDLDRAMAVEQELRKCILHLISFRYFSSGDRSATGSKRPYGSDPIRNRRAVVCIRWKIDPTL